MRILFVGVNYWPEKTGIAVFNTRRCEHLARRGHQVTVVTGMPYYPEWRVAAGYRGRLWRNEGHHGVEILRVPLYVPRRVSLQSRFLHEATFVLGAAARALTVRRPDLAFVVSPPLGLGVVASALVRRWRLPYVFHVEDIQPDAAADLGMLRDPWLLKILYGFERRAYRGAALVSTLTGAMADRLRSKGVPGEKLAVMPHWIDPHLSTLPLEGHDEPLRRELGIGDRFIVLHAGNMGVKQGLGVVLDAADRLRARQDVLFLLVGDGAERRALEAEVGKRSLSNVRFQPLLPERDFRRLLAITQVALVVQQRSVADIVFPSKVVTLLAAGRPLVASVASGSEVARVVRESGGGFVVEPESPAALCDAVGSLRESPGLRSTMAGRGRSYAAIRWSPERSLAAMDEAIERLLPSMGGTRRAAG